LSHVSSAWGFILKHFSGFLKALLVAVWQKLFWLIDTTNHQLFCGAMGWAREAHFEPCHMICDGCQATSLKTFLNALTVKNEADAAFVPSGDGGYKLCLCPECQRHRCLGKFGDATDQNIEAAMMRSWVKPDAAPGSPANADEQRGELLELAAASGSRNEIPAEDELRAWSSDSIIEMLRRGACELSRRQPRQSQSSTEAPPSAAGLEPALGSMVGAAPTSAPDVATPV